MEKLAVGRSAFDWECYGLFNIFGNSARTDDHRCFYDASEGWPELGIICATQ